MGGLPRSGSTLLTAILNQHPEVYSSPQSDLINMYFSLQNEIYNSESWKSNLMVQGYQNTLDSLGNVLYSHIKKPIIIDKNRAWGTPGNQFVAEVLNKKPKTILMLRPISEVLSSFVKLAEKNPNNFIDDNITRQDFYVKYYKEKNDVRCDYLMRSNGEIDQSLLAIATLLTKPESCHLVWYDNFITNPQKTLSGIYQFLEIQDFKHNFSHIKQLDKHNDDLVFGIKDLHTISSSIKPSKTTETILSSYVLSKYKNVLDFIPR
jgi:sulfotransferase